MEELFFSKVAGRSNQMVPDMRRAYKPEIKDVKKSCAVISRRR